MIAAIFAAAALAAAPPAAPPPKEPTVAELKAENADLKQHITLLGSLVNELRAQRNQSADLVADVSARYDALTAAMSPQRPTR